MRSIFVIRGSLRWSIFLSGAVLVCLAYFLVPKGRKPAGSVVPVVRSCKTLGLGMRRVGAGAFQFDVPEEGFTIKHFASDAPSGSYGFSVKPSSSTSYLLIQWDPKIGIESMRPTTDPALTFVGPVQNRKIIDNKGNVIGEDAWGYWGDREFWRRVRLKGSVVARYGSINQGDLPTYGSVFQQDAQLFNQVINSVCIEPSQGDTK